MTNAASEPSKGSAIITGAAQGIGRAIALRLADDGYDIAANDVPSKQDALNTLVEEIITKGRKAVAIQADVSCEEEVRGMVEQTVEKLGGLDVVRVLLACPAPA